MTDYQNYIALSRYARYLEDQDRRESWPDTVDRYYDFMRHVSGKPKLKEWDEAHEHTLSMDVMPSMRALMTAGKALERDHVAAYNCSYLTINHPRSLDEIVYVLMCGTGVGFSVESRFTSKLPEVPQLYSTDTTIVVEDSKIGWASAYRELVHLLYAGKRPRWDTSKVRPAGERLRTFGGRASGPGPLEDLFEFTVRKFVDAQNRQLKPIELHDIACKIGEIVVVGGVRRSAEISLSDLGDNEMRYAKSGEWWRDNPQRALANNSAVYDKRPDLATFMSEWQSLYLSKSGERGIFNRDAARRKFTEIGRQVVENTVGINPCAEILLRPFQFCNLTEVVIRPDDNQRDLERKVRIATFLGTVQSTLTNFRYLRAAWRKNCEEERLLGVSLTGIMSNPATFDPDPALLSCLRTLAWEKNLEYAELLGVNPSTAITCVKPSGTVSQLVGTTSGIHPAHADYYIRRVQCDNKDPLTQFMIDSGVPHEPLSTKPADVTVLEFPHRSPAGSVTRHTVSALDQLNLWLTYRTSWCDHNPSCTIYIRENEWLDVAAWVWRNFDECGGLSFLPYDGGTYKQAPYEEIDAARYNELVAAFPPIPWQDFKEHGDNTTGSQEPACTGGQCDL